MIGLMIDALERAILALLAAGEDEDLVRRYVDDILRDAKAQINRTEGDHA